MVRRIGRFSTEMMFVAGALILLKEWFFPLIIALWFPDPFMAETLREWTALLAGTVFLLAQAGLGSSARQVHRLSVAESAVSFWGVHLLIGWIPPVAGAWRNLAADLANPFAPGVSFGMAEWMAVCFLLQLLGRGIRISEGEGSQAPLRAKGRQKMRTF